MSNLWFNIRIMHWHFQLSNDWKIEVESNVHWRLHGKWKEQPFAIYCLFGKHFS